MVGLALDAPGYMFMFGSVFCFVEVPKREKQRIGEDGQHNSLHEKWEDSFLPLKDKEPSDPRALAQMREGKIQLLRDHIEVVFLFLFVNREGKIEKRLHRFVRTIPK